MNDGPDTDSSPTAEGGDGRVEDAFDLVRNELRVSILQALAQAQAESPFDAALRFSDLRARLDNPDSGTFNYHLGRLQGRFVTRTQAGYELTPAGHRLVAAIAAGAYETGGTIEDTELDQSCPVCDDPVALSYDDGVLSIRCDAGHGIMNLFPGGALADRTIPEIQHLFDRRTRQEVDLALDGACPMCFAPMTRRLVDGSVDSNVDAGEDVPTFTDTVGVEARCDRCGAIVRVPLPVALLEHPVVQAMLTATGHDPRQEHFWIGGERLDWSIERDHGGSASVYATVTLGDDRATFRVTRDWDVSVTETPPWLDWPTQDARPS